MDSFAFDNVKAEKEDALWRYNMERKLRIGLRLVGFLLALFLLLWSWFPTLIPDTVEVVGDFRHRFVSTFNEPLFTFVVVNIIIFAVYVLSRQKNNQKKANTIPDIYDEYASSRQSIPTSAIVTAAASYSPATEESVVDKQIVLVENGFALSPVKQQRTTVDAVTETKISLSTVKQPTTSRTVAKTKPETEFSSTEVKQKEYRRTRSMVSESRNQKPREFGRSETAISSRKLVISGIEQPRKSMDEMSSEEFQLKIDSFIAERKKTLMLENTAHYAWRKKSIVAKS